MIDSAPISFNIRKKAKEILDEKLYRFFINMIEDYKVSPKTLYWDIVCFLVSCKIKKQKRKQFNEWIDFWTSYTKRERYYKHMKYLVPGSYLPFLPYSKSHEFYFYSLLEEKKQKREISWGDYIEILYTIQSELKPIFTRNEFIVFNTILKIQDGSV